MENIVCFGDSITDAFLTLGANIPYGEGYVAALACRLKGKANVINAGITGNRIVDMALRLNDVISKHPDEIFILGGVNDSWRRFDHLAPWTTDEEFERTYRDIVIKLKEACPSAHIALLTPYVLVISPLNKEIDGDLRPKIEIVKKIAKEESVELIDLNEAMQKELKVEDALEFTMDGIHPKGKGCDLVARLIEASYDKRNKQN